MDHPGQALAAALSFMAYNRPLVGISKTTSKMLIQQLLTFHISHYVPFPQSQSIFFSVTKQKST